MCFNGNGSGGGGAGRLMKVRLPSDGLTKKQWKERCGKLMTYQLGCPMKWEQFKQMPSELQEKYIQGLQDRFGVNAASLSEMFGITALTVRRHVAANELGVVFPVGKSMSKEQRERWNDFLGITSEEPPNEQKPNPEEESQKIVADEDSNMMMRSVCLRFSGAIDISGIANSLRLILGDHPYGQVEISCELR